MLFLRLLGVNMADELPETAGAATRNLLGAVGFIMILLGGEILLEKTGDRSTLGLVLVIGGIPIFFAGVFWRWLQQRLASGISAKVNLVASDRLSWIVMLLVFVVVSLPVLGISLESYNGGWILKTLVLLAGICVLLPWRVLGTGSNLASARAAAPPAIDGQTKLDLIHLIDFGIDQTTVVTLERLIETSTGPEATHGSNPEELHQSRNFYVGWVRQRLDGHRLDSYRGVLQNAQFEAERTLRETPPDQRPAGDPLNVREHAISQLQFTRTVQFLQHEKHEVEDRLISKRSQLIERRDLRNREAT